MELYVLPATLEYVQGEFKKMEDLKINNWILDSLNERVNFLVEISYLTTIF